MGHAAAIGYVVTNWGRVEARLAQTVGFLLGINTMPTHAVTAEMSSADRMEMISTLLNLAGRNRWISEWKSLASDLKDLRTKRNDVVHAEWCGTQNSLMPNTGVRVKARGRAQIKLHFPSTAALRDLAGLIELCEDRLAILQGKLITGGAAALIASPNPPGADPSRGPSGGARVRARDTSPRRVPKREMKQERKAKIAAFLKAKKPAS